MVNDQEILVNDNEIEQSQEEPVNQIPINISTTSPILFISDKITGVRTEYLNQESEVGITINNKLFKKTFFTEEAYIEGIREINNLRDTVNEEELYNSNFRAEAVSFTQAIKNNWKTNLLVGLISTASAAGTVLLMSKDGELGIEGDGNGIWSPPQASDGVGKSTRAINAIAPLALTLLSSYVNENKYAWERSTYDKLQTLIAVGDLGAMVATLGETYAFNRGNLTPEDMYRPEALLKKENFEKVFWNDFSKWFIFEQGLRLSKDAMKIIHHTTGYIAANTVSKLENLINNVSALIVSGAFANVTYGIDNYHGQNPGHGIEVLPSNSKIKSTIGVTAVAAGAYFGTATAVSNFCSWIKSCFSQNENNDNIQNVVDEINPQANDQENDLNQENGIDEVDNNFISEDLQDLLQELVDPSALLPKHNLDRGEETYYNTGQNSGTSSQNIDSPKKEVDDLTQDVNPSPTHSEDSGLACLSN